jgi:signal transduction histidine kinase
MTTATTAVPYETLDAARTRIIELETLLDYIVGGTTDGTWTVDVNLRLVSLNEAFRFGTERLFGINLKPGNLTLDGFPPPIADLWRERYARVLKGETFTILDYFEPTDQFTETSFFPVYDRDKTIFGATMYMRDVSDRERAERERRKAEAARDELIRELQQSLIFKDQFLATMSHELRTPMNAIMGYTSIALQRDDLTDEVRAMLERVMVNSERLYTLLTDVLNISRINAGRVELVDEAYSPRALIEGWHHDLLNQMDEKGLAFEVIPDPSLPARISGDHERLTQIVTNLLNNAIKFTDTGTITLRARVEGNNLIIDVQDTGIGIPQTYHHLIFEEFRQVDMTSGRRFGGTGLGLSIVQKLCTLMGGTVTVASEVGMGSTFTVTLPIKIVTPAAASSEPVPA